MFERELAFAPRAGRPGRRRSAWASSATRLRGDDRRPTCRPSPRPTSRSRRWCASASPTPSPATRVLGEEEGGDADPSGRVVDRRPDRRHRELRARHPDLGHADRAAGRRRLRCSVVVEAPALGERYAAVRGDGRDVQRRADPRERRRRARPTRTCCSRGIETGCRPALERGRARDARGRPRARGASATSGATCSWLAAPPRSWSSRELVALGLRGARAHRGGGRRPHDDVRRRPARRRRQRADHERRRCTTSSCEPVRALTGRSRRRGSIVSPASPARAITTFAAATSCTPRPVRSHTVS